MKYVSFVFSEKEELEHKRKSELQALFGITSIWGWQNEMFH